MSTPKSKYKIEGSAERILKEVYSGTKVTDIAEKLKLSRTTVSMHLKRLYRDGYIRPVPCTWEITDYGKKFI